MRLAVEPTDTLAVTPPSHHRRDLFGSLGCWMLLALISLLGCRAPSTQVQLFLDTDAPLDRALNVEIFSFVGPVASDELQRRADAVLMGTIRLVRSNSGMGTFTSGGSIGILPAPERLGVGNAVTVWIRATLAASAGNPEIRIDRTARVTFVRGRVGTARVFLSIRCGDRSDGCSTVSSEQCTVSVRCREQNATCGDMGECVAPEVPVVFSSADGAVEDTPSARNVDAVSGRVDSGLDAGLDVVGDIFSDVRADIPQDILTDTSTNVPADSPTDVATDVPTDVPSDVPTDVQMCPGAAPTFCSGACVDTQTSAIHCGRCGNICSRVPNASPLCILGGCSQRCNVGFSDCDANLGNGCESNLTNSVMNCGACGTMCPAPGNGTPSCVASTCSINCNMGFQLLGGRCVLANATPRQLAPLSLGEVTLFRPTLRWATPVGDDGAEVDLCRDRACTMVIETVRGAGGAVRPSMSLTPASVVFWRARATVGAATSMVNSPTWLFHVPATNALGMIDTTARPHLDVNGDGFDDIVVGANNATRMGRTSTGSVSIFHGGVAGVAPVASRVIDGLTANEEFGRSVASAGDVNGDGYGDLVVGAFHASNLMAGALAGRVSVFHGSATGIPAVAAMQLYGNAGDEFGHVVACAGDVNADGFADIVLGAPHASPMGRLEAGSVSVYYGNVGGIPAVASRVLDGSTAGDNFGTAVASVGDANADGYTDVVVGAPLADPMGQLDAGGASVYYGSLGGIPAMPGRVYTGLLAGDEFGHFVASAGDVNADGYSDLVIGAYHADPGGRSNAGTVSIYNSNAMGVSAAATLVLQGVLAGDEFGRQMSSAGDVNRDGFGDLIVGAAQASPGGRLNAGSASVFHGSAGGIIGIPARVLDGVSIGDRFARSLSGAGDANNDGFADIVVGVFLADPMGLVSAGSASVYYGTLGGIGAAPGRILDNATAGDEFGRSVAELGRPWRRPRALRSFVR